MPSSTVSLINQCILGLTWGTFQASVGAFSLAGTVKAHRKNQELIRTCVLNSSILLIGEWTLRKSLNVALSAFRNSSSIPEAPSRVVPFVSSLISSAAFAYFQSLDGKKEERSFSLILYGPIGIVSGLISNQVGFPCSAVAALVNAIVLGFFAGQIGD